MDDIQGLVCLALEQGVFAVCVVAYDAEGALGPLVRGDVVQTGVKTHVHVIFHTSRAQSMTANTRVQSS